MSHDKMKPQSFAVAWFGPDTNGANIKAYDVRTAINNSSIDAPLEQAVTCEKIV